MKKNIFQILVIVMIFCVYLLRYEIIETYITFKNPSPVDFRGLKIPIENGYLYSKDENTILISHPFSNTYTVHIVSNFKCSPEIASFKEYLEISKEMVLKVDTFEENDINYIEAYSVDRNWQFKVSMFLSNYNLLILYSGPKLYYENFKIFASYIIENIHSYQLVEKRGE